jgi:hypothetical protein
VGLAKSLPGLSFSFTPIFIAQLNVKGLHCGHSLPRDNRHFQAFRLGRGDKPHCASIARYFRPARDQNTASIPVLQRISAATIATQPEMLHGMSVGRLLTGQMILVETKQSALPIVKGSLTILVCAD